MKEETLKLANELKDIVKRSIESVDNANEAIKNGCSGIALIGFHCAVYWVTNLSPVQIAEVMRLVHKLSNETLIKYQEEFKNL